MLSPVPPGGYLNVFNSTAEIGEPWPDPIDPDDEVAWGARADYSYALGLAGGTMLVESLTCRLGGVLPTFAPCAVMHRPSPEAKFELAFFPDGMPALQRWRETATRRDAVLIREGTSSLHIGILDEDPARAWALHCVLEVVVTDGQVAMSELGVHQDHATHLHAFAFIEGLDDRLAGHPRLDELAAAYGQLGPPKV